MTPIEVGTRVRTEAWPDLLGFEGTVRSVDRGRAHVVWDRREQGVSWLKVEELIVLT